MALYSVMHLVGQVLFGGYFIYSGIRHFTEHKNFTAYSVSMKVPSPALAVYATGALLLLGGLGVILNMYTHIALWLLVIFLIPTTVMMHAFWKVTDPQMRMVNKINFFKNVALLGAVLWMM